jgi:hypothetical protein
MSPLKSMAHCTAQIAAKMKRGGGTATGLRSFHFGTKEYSACFHGLPVVDTQRLRDSTISYLDSFDAELWYTDPIATLVNGENLGGSELADTLNALGKVNGKQALATPDQVNKIKAHIVSYESPYKDLRTEIRNVEENLMSEYAGFLIGNQCLDFQKQDGITEIEESIMANTIERRLNDFLLRDEAEGVVEISRKPIYVSCVSNFTNFLDLSRKTLRSLEVGIPCIVLGRSDTSQHSYRWTQLLLQLILNEGIDPGMLTFVSSSLNQIEEITTSCQNRTGNLYATCSRELAASIKQSYFNTIASTGGPNTLLTTTMDENVRLAIKTSATIESSGRCTALRHCVVPLSTKDEDIMGIFDSVKEISDGPFAVKNKLFDGIYANHEGSAIPSGLDRHENVDAFIKISDHLPVLGIKEFWRKVTVDFSRVNPTNEEDLDRLVVWLNENQPISLAINGPRLQVLKLGRTLFERTGMVVYTIGSPDKLEMPPAMTCQARPQEGECFGEFPPRASLSRYTKYPVVVPSSNPSYDAKYTTDYLRKLSVSEFFGKSTQAILDHISESTVLGYCILLIEYLQNATGQNPKRGLGVGRTSLWGLQRPPLGMKSFVHCGKDTTWDELAPIYIIFHVTTARDQIELSIDPQNKVLIKQCSLMKLPLTEESKQAMEDRLKGRNDVFSIVDAEPLQEFPMVGQFVSVYLPLGHIKSTMPNDEEFALRAAASNKWLTTLF